MNKNLLFPIGIILAGVVFGGVLLFSGNDTTDTLDENVAQAGLRKVDLEIQNMFCVGCRSSVVNYLLGLPGVVQADANPRTDSGWVIYDSYIPQIKNMANIHTLVKMSIPPATFFMVSVLSISVLKNVCLPCPMKIVTAIRNKA